MRTRALATAASAALVALACAERHPTPTLAGALPAGVVARVGKTDIAALTVAAIAERRGLVPRAALDLAIADAVAAEAADAALAPGLRASIQRAAAARALLEALKRDADAAGDPSDAELRAVFADRWVELDRPASVRVSHAVALRPKSGGADAARRAGQQLAQVLAPLHDPSEFLRVAKALNIPGITIRAERLPFITADGRSISVERPRAPAGDFDPAFAKAANAIPQIGEQSPLIETSFGFHVILLEERLPEQHTSLTEGRRALRSEVLSRRAEHARGELVSELRRRVPTDVSRDAEAQTARGLCAVAGICPNPSTSGR